MCGPESRCRVRRPNNRTRYHSSRRHESPSWKSTRLYAAAKKGARLGQSTDVGVMKPDANRIDHGSCDNWDTFGTPAKLCHQYGHQLRLGCESDREKRPDCQPWCVIQCPVNTIQYRQEVLGIHILCSGSVAHEWLILSHIVVQLVISRRPYLRFTFPVLENTVLDGLVMVSLLLEPPGFTCRKLDFNFRR